MNEIGGTALPWLHPLTGLMTVVLVTRAAGLALAARRGGALAARRRTQHGELAAWVWWLVFGNWLLGLGTVWVYRPELSLAASTHFLSGTMLLALLTVGRWLSRRMPRDPWARTLHPWVGLAALVVAGVQTFLGLQLVRW